MPKLDMDDSLDLSADWVTTAPVRRLAGEEFASHGGWLKAQLEAMTTAPAPHDDPAMAAAARSWNERLGEGIERAGVIEASGATSYVQSYAYFYSGKPVAMMMLDMDVTKERGVLYIDSIVSHAGARNGGDILIEYAVNLSEEMGLDGKVALSSVRGAVWFYESVGFVATPGIGLTKCELNPAATPAQWSRLGGNWKLTAVWRGRGDDRALTSYAGLRYRN